MHTTSRISLKQYDHLRSLLLLLLLSFLWFTLLMLYVHSININAYVYMGMYMCTCKYIGIYIGMCMCACVYVCVYICMSVYSLWLRLTLISTIRWHLPLILMSAIYHDLRWNATLFYLNHRFEVAATLRESQSYLQMSKI